MVMRDVGLEIATADRTEKSVVAHLLQLYLHDFSDFAIVGQPYGDVDQGGLFQYDHLDAYWTDTKREPLLFRAFGQIVGFALVNGWSASGLDVTFSIAEFFILRKYRAIGLGKRAAHRIIEARPGTWEIPVAHYNLPALKFWRSTTAAMTDRAVDEITGDGELWAGPILRLGPISKSK